MSHQGISNLLPDSFLDLKSPGEDVQQPSQFRYSNDFTVGDVGNHSSSPERQHMMFTSGVKLYVLQINQTTHSITIELLENIIWILLVSREQFLPGPDHP